MHELIRLMKLYIKRTKLGSISHHNIVSTKGQKSPSTFAESIHVKREPLVVVLKKPGDAVSSIRITSIGGKDKDDVLPISLFGNGVNESFTRSIRDATTEKENIGVRLFSDNVNWITRITWRFRPIRRKGVGFHRVIRPAEFILTTYLTYVRRTFLEQRSQARC